MFHRLTIVAICLAMIGASLACDVAPAPREKTATAVAAVSGCGQLASQSGLASGQSVASCNGQYQLVMQGDGNVVELNSAGQAIWVTGTGGTAAALLLMQGDGNLVLSDAGHTHAYWASGTCCNSGAYLSVQDDGNLVVHSATGTVLWSAEGGLMPGAELVKNGFTDSYDGRFRLILGVDGNLILYFGTTPLWMSNTGGTNAAVLTMQGDGNLVLSDVHYTTAYWTSNSSGNPGAYLAVQGDGNLVVYAPNGTVLWASNTNVHWVNLDTSMTTLNGVTQPLGGRVDVIRVDPRNAKGDVVYVGTYGGGVWKTTNFTSASRTWQPMSDFTPSLAIGGMDLDPQSPDWVYVGLGDPWDVRVGSVMKSTDGGAHWGPPVQLSGTYFVGVPGGTFVSAAHVKDLVVDPVNHNVLVATDVGLFRSTDQGVTYQLIDMPNFAGQTIDNVQSLAFVGSAIAPPNGVGASTWVAAGCSPGAKPWCQDVDAGDLWRSTDSGATWQSIRGAGGLLTIGPDGLHGMTVAAATGYSPDKAPVFVLADAGKDGGGDAGPEVHHTSLYRSLDGGQTFSPISGAIQDPTNCKTTDEILGTQGWFDRAVAVDPSNANHVLFGGQTCSVRTLNALSAFPIFGEASFGQGAGGYVHGDWHTALVTFIGGVTRTFSGNDGGIFSSTNLWSVPRDSEGQIAWTDDNKGIISQKVDFIGGSDPSRGQGDVITAGLADQGVQLGYQSGGAWLWSQTAGGDGGPGAINAAANSSTFTFWQGNATTSFCIGGPAFCAPGNWSNGNVPSAPGDDSFTSFAPVLTDLTNLMGQLFLAAKSVGLWKVSVTANGGTPIWTTLAPSGNKTNLQNVAASPTVDGLYGAAASGGISWVIRDGSPPALTVSKPISPAYDLTSIAFPPQTPAGQRPGDTYVVSVGDAWSCPSSCVFKTTDRGQTWTALGQGLPAGGAFAVAYDPSDATDNTLYVTAQTGVYVSRDAGQTWSPLGDGLPSAWARSLTVSLDGRLLRVGTRGRGIWELPLPLSVASSSLKGGPYDVAVGSDTPAARYRLDEAPGATTVVDSNGSATGTVHGSVTFGASGALDSEPSTTAASFDGQTQWIDLGNPPELQRQTSGNTVEAWIKTTNNDGSIHAIAIKWFAYGMFLQNGRLVAFDWGPNVVRDSGVFVADGAWHHVCLTFLGSGANAATLYVDGVARVNFTNHGVNDLNDAMIASGSSTNPTQFFPGTIDEVAFYSSQLPASRVLAHYIAGRYQGLITSTGPSAYYRFEDAAGSSVAADSSGNNLTGTVEGGANVAFQQAGAITHESSTFSAFFDGAGWIDLGHPSLLAVSNGSVEAWVNTTVADSAFHAIAIKWLAYGLFLSNGHLFTFDWHTSTPLDSGAFIADGSWHHVAMTFQSGVPGGTVLYVDGNPKLTTEITVADQAHDAIIASGSSTDPQQFFTGKIDEVAFYPQVLTPAQLQAHVVSGRH